jgi:hypothetical protein
MLPIGRHFPSFFFSLPPSCHDHYPFRHGIMGEGLLTECRPRVHDLCGNRLSREIAACRRSLEPWPAAAEQARAHFPRWRKEDNQPTFFIRLATLPIPGSWLAPESEMQISQMDGRRKLLAAASSGIGIKSAEPRPVPSPLTRLHFASFPHSLTPQFPCSDMCSPKK